MQEHPIDGYIREAQKNGIPNRQIVDSLVSTGWKVEEILEVMLQKSVPGNLPLTGADAADFMINVENVSKFFDQIKALDNVNLQVRKGRVMALLGPNGAGKTTLVRILTTLLTPSEGKATVSGLDVVNDAQQLRSSIGLTGQYAAVDEILSGRENLEMVGRLYHLPKDEAGRRAAELLRQFELEEAADRQVKTYSGGMRRRLDLAASLIVRPKILFLDEPTSGLDPRSRFALWNVIRDLVEEGTTVLLTTQYLEEADQLAHYIFVIDHGRIIAQGTSDELKRKTGGDVLELHLTVHDKAAEAAEAVREFGDGEPFVNQTSGIVTMPTEKGAAVLVDVVRKLDESNLKLSDVMLRRPSLDDVFMKLTGHSAE
jgi:ABC-2 type transport system ATP-binding protein